MRTMVKPLEAHCALKLKVNEEVEGQGQGQVQGPHGLGGSMLAVWSF